MPRHHGGQMSEFSYGSGGRSPSEFSYVTTRTTRSGKVKGKIEVAENPMCPRIRGLCCLMLLFNLALILICLGFALVLQFFDPPFVWYLGVFMLVFGFIALVGSFIYCVVICQDYKEKQESQVQRIEDPEFYWSKNLHRSTDFGSSSEINYDNISGRSIDPREHGSSYNSNHTLQRY